MLPSGSQTCIGSSSKRSHDLGGMARTGAAATPICCISRKSAANPHRLPALSGESVSSLHSTRRAHVPPILSGLRSGLPTRSTRAMTPADGRQRRRRGRRTALFSGMHPQPLARLRLIASSKEPSIACDYGNFTVAEGLTEPEPRSRTLALWERAKRPLGECGVRDASLIAPTPAR